MVLPRAKLSLCMGLGCAAAVSGAALAWAHPLWPGWILAAFACWLATSTVRPGAWLFAIPACLPWMSLAPWTGWILFDEFDLVLLGAIGGGYLRWAISKDEPVEAAGVAASRWAWTVWLFGAFSVAALVKGLAGVGVAMDPFRGEVDPINGLRVFKSLGFAVLLWPLWQREGLASMTCATRRLGNGILTGLVVVVLAALWERTAYPGLLDFTAPYRTAALFWEMHVGGAALDAYLALSVPFVVWGLWRASSLRSWLGFSVLAVLVGYVCLTTFSRGVYVGVAVPLLLLGVFHAMARRGAKPWPVARRAAVLLLVVAAAAGTFGMALARFGLAGSAIALAFTLCLLAIVAFRGRTWRAVAVYGLGLALLFEMMVVLHAGSFMSERLAASQHDFGSRQAHWQHGLTLLDTPADWLWGIGLGRLPNSYASTNPSRELSGAFEVASTLQGRQVARLKGPSTQADLGGLYAMTQRLPANRTGAYRLQMDARATGPAQLQVRVCEMHLLYESRCQAAILQVSSGGSTWQRWRLFLEGPAFADGAWYAPRMRVLAVSVLSPGVEVEIADLRLYESAGRQVLANSDFAQGQARWFPAAQSYFLPWHIDSLYLELLIERGLLGLLAFLAMVAAALWSLMTASTQAQPMAVFVAASLLGVLIVGLVSSVFDVPRVAFQFQFLIVVGLTYGQTTTRRDLGSTLHAQAR